MIEHAMTWTDQQVEAELKAKGPTAFQMSDRCSRCGGYWSSHSNARAPSGTLEYYAQCNSAVVGANGIQTFTALTTTFLPITQSNAVQPASCNGDVMTDQEVEDWVNNNPHGKYLAFPMTEVCTRCGVAWDYHGLVGSGNILTHTCCVQRLGPGVYVPIPGTFMPTNLPAGFVRQAPVNNNPTTAGGSLFKLTFPGFPAPNNVPSIMIDIVGKPAMKQSPLSSKEADLSDWKAWRDVNRRSDECACGMKRELCDYHK
jgi:hypothetical protein